MSGAVMPERLAGLIPPWLAEVVRPKPAPWPWPDMARADAWPKAVEFIRRLRA